MWAQADGRSPHGERGLKSGTHAGHRGRKRRSPHGERGLKCRVGKAPVNEYRRSPHGERGLKSCVRRERCGGRVALLMESVD